MRRRLSLLLCCSPLWLAGCDQLGIESASAVASRNEATGKAVGAACRHAGRAIEDCYTLNKKADKGAVFAGWKEMNDYMRENKIEEVKPVIPVNKPAPPASAPASAPEGEDEAPAAAHGKKGH
jgi:hypothetical protein